MSEVQYERLILGEEITSFSDLICDIMDLFSMEDEDLSMVFEVDPLTVSKWRRGVLKPGYTRSQIMLHTFKEMLVGEKKFIPLKRLRGKDYDEEYI